MDNEPLDRILTRETLDQIQAQLEPWEVMITLLRLGGLTDDEIATYFSVSRSAITKRMARLQERLVQALPELASQVVSRQRSGFPDPLRRQFAPGWAGDRRRTRREPC